MTELRGWGTSVPHLLPDAIVAFVDGELAATAHDRATLHMQSCTFCAREIAAQRQARSAVRSADAPSMSAGLMAALRNIPQDVELPSSPDGLAVSADGQLVTVQRPDRAAALAATPLGTAPLGSSPRLGEGSAVLGRRAARRTAQGAGVVVSGLVLGALAFAGPGGTTDRPAPAPAGGVNPAAVGGAATQPSTRPSAAQLVVARFGAR